LPIYAGIDEAGYGPLLGPLVVSCAAFACEKPEADLWNDLAPVVRLTAAHWDGLVVQDSKLLFRRPHGIRRLEEGCLSFVTASTGHPPETLGELLLSLGADLSTDSYPWYDLAHDLPLPLSADRGRIDALAGDLASAAGPAKIAFASFHAHPVLSGTLNDEVTAGKNKADVVYQRVAEHLKTLLEATDAEVFLTCDKLGGRNHYAPMLQQSFNSWVHIGHEGRNSSQYLMQIDGRPVRVSFVKNGERQAPTVALASMFSKYLRELLLHLLNSYWCRRVGGLAPTSGYVQDARRFIADIGEHPDYHKYRPLLVRLR